MHTCSFHISSYQASRSVCIFNPPHTKGVILLFTHPRVSFSHAHFTHNSGYRFRRTHHQAVKELFASLRQNSGNQSIIKPIFITILYKRTHVYCMSPYKEWAVNITINDLAISIAINYLFMVYLPGTWRRRFWILFWWCGRGWEYGVRTSNLEWNADYSVRRISSVTPDIWNETATTTSLHFSKPTFTVTPIIPCYIITAWFTLIIILKT